MNSKHNRQNSDKITQLVIKKIDKKSKKNSRQVDGIQALSNKMTRIPAQMAIMADRYYCRMTYTDYSSTTIPATGQVFNRRFRPTNAFDIDPLLGGTSMPGFAELSALYLSYRVTMSRIRVRFTAGTGSLPTEVTVVPLNLDLGSTPAVSTVAGLPGQSYAKTKLLGIAGSPTIEISSEMSTEKTYGSQAVYFDDNFSSLVTGGPTNNWYWNISGLVPSAASSASVIYVQSVMDIGIEFFDKRELPT